jgi:hypothetical protein
MVDAFLERDLAVNCSTVLAPSQPETGMLKELRMWPGVGQGAVGIIASVLDLDNHLCPMA